MFDPTVIRAALAANIAALAAAEGFQVSQYMIGPSPPAIEISGIEEIRYDVAMQRGGDQNNVLVRAFVSTGLSEGTQQKLDRLLASSGATSMKAAIESDPTLGGACDDLRVTDCSGYVVYPTATGNVLGAEWTIQIETTG